MAAYPLVPSHIIAVPKRHVESINNFTSDEAKDLFVLAHKMQARITEKEGLDCIITQNYGKHSSQPHIHFHILPGKGGTRDLYAQYHGVGIKLEVEDLDALAKQFISFQHS